MCCLRERDELFVCSDVALLIKAVISASVSLELIRSTGVVCCVSRDWVTAVLAQPHCLAPT